MTKDEAKELLGIKGGADVWGYINAKRLRLIQREVNPAFLKIVPAMDAPKNGAQRQPYFGAIATPAGLEAAKLILKKPTPKPLKDT